MIQKPLWEDDPYALLMTENVSKLGRFRLRRYLNWLDTTGSDWKAPDLEAYGLFLSEAHGLSDQTIVSELSRIRNHYRVVLTHPDTITFLPGEQRAHFIQNILDKVGFKDPQTVLYNAEAKTENLWVIVPDGSSSTMLQRFARWLDESGRPWTEPDIPYYRSVLSDEGLTPKNVKNYIRTVRRRYEELREDKDILAMLSHRQREDFLQNLNNRLGYSNVYDKKFRVEDDPSSWAFWLSPEQERLLISQPNISTLIGLRDRAIIGLALYTGAKPFEIKRLDVLDVCRGRDGASGVLFPATDSQPERFVPYQPDMPDVDWVLAWLNAANIKHGAVFRSVYTRSSRLREGRLSAAAMTQMLQKYPVIVEGRERELIFPDLRCTYARRLYEGGRDLDTIQSLLGYSSISSLLQFMGLHRV